MHSERGKSKKVTHPLSTWDGLCVGHWKEQTHFSQQYFLTRKAPNHDLDFLRLRRWRTRCQPCLQKKGWKWPTSNPSFSYKSVSVEEIKYWSSCTPIIILLDYGTKPYVHVYYSITICRSPLLIPWENKISTRLCRNWPPIYPLISVLYSTRFFTFTCFFET